MYESKVLEEKWDIHLIFKNNKHLLVHFGRGICFCSLALWHHKQAVIDVQGDVWAPFLPVQAVSNLPAT